MLKSKTTDKEWSQCDWIVNSWNGWTNTKEKKFSSRVFLNEKVLWTYRNYVEMDA